MPAQTTQPDTGPAAGPEPMPMAMAIHRLMANVRPHPLPVSRRDVPADGIYILYEAGETITIEGETLERIVGVGTHSGDGRLARRLGIHASGDRRGSDVRLHLGSALLARQGARDAEIQTWMTQPRTPMPDAEAIVSAELRERFSVRCLPTADNVERQSLTRALGWLLSGTPAGDPTTDWLGRRAARADVRATGLWIIPPGDWLPFHRAQFARLSAIVAATLTATEPDDQP